jgi:cell division septum initiation protein DivIVA
VQLALREWESHAEGLVAEIRATRAELDQARVATEAAMKELHAEFGAKVVRIVDAAKKEGESILAGAKQQAQASLTAAREEARENIAAARREAARIRTEAEQAGTRLASRTEARLEGVSSTRPGMQPAGEISRPRSIDASTPSKRPGIEPLDDRWIDQLWSET